MSIHEPYIYGNTPATHRSCHYHPRTSCIIYILREQVCSIIKLEDENSIIIIIRNKETLQSKIKVCKSDVKIGDCAHSLTIIKDYRPIVQCKPSSLLRLYACRGRMMLVHGHFREGGRQYPSHG